MLRNWRPKPRRVRPYSLPWTEAPQATIARTKRIASHINALITGIARDLDGLPPATGNETIKSALQHVEGYVYDEGDTQWRNIAEPNTLAMMFFESAIYDYLSTSHKDSDIKDMIALIYATGKQYLFFLKVSQLFNCIHLAYEEAGQGCCCTIPDGLSRCWHEIANLYKPDQTQAAISDWIEQHQQLAYGDTGNLPADSDKAHDNSIPVLTLKRLKSIIDEKQSTISWSSLFGLRQEKTSRLYESISRKIAISLTLYEQILKDTGTAKPYTIGTMVSSDPIKQHAVLESLIQLRQMEIMRRDVPDHDKFPRQNGTQAADAPPRQPHHFSNTRTVAGLPNARY
jgi:hypothetical protein